MAQERPIAAFTVRLLPPWEDLRLDFTGVLSLKGWMMCAGAEEGLLQMDGVTKWMQQAKVGDVVYLDDESRIKPCSEGADYELRCNRALKCN